MCIRDRIETIRDILRRAYGTHFSKGFFHYRLVSIGIVTGAVVLMLISFSMQVLIVGIEQFVERVLPSAYQSAGVVAISRGVSGLGLFAAIYFLFLSLTPSKYRGRQFPKWPGALFTTLWWMAVTLALPPLLASLFRYDATYGSLAGVMIALFFFYLVGLGMVIGAELNAALVEVEDLGHDAIAVSYTHLDVYKRQHEQRAFVQAMRPVLPEVDSLGRHAPARPAGRTRHVLPFEARLHFGKAAFEAFTRVERTRLLAGPGAELAVAAARREIGISGCVVDGRYRAFDANLSAQRLPVKEQGDMRVRRKLAALAAVEIGVEDEPVGAMPV